MGKKTNYLWSTEDSIAKAEQMKLGMSCMMNNSGKGLEYGFQIKTTENTSSKYTRPLIMIVDISQWVLVVKTQKNETKKIAYR